MGSAARSEVRRRRWWEQAAMELLSEMREGGRGRGKGREDGDVSVCESEVCEGMGPHRTASEVRGCSLHEEEQEQVQRGERLPSVWTYHAVLQALALRGMRDEMEQVGYGGNHAGRDTHTHTHTHTQAAGRQADMVAGRGWRADSEKSRQMHARRMGNAGHLMQPMPTPWFLPVVMFCTARC